MKIRTIDELSELEPVLRADLESRLSERRLNHSYEVAKSARELAVRFGGDPEKAYISGLVHDILKEDDKNALEYFEKNAVGITDIERASYKLWHAMAGAHYLEHNYFFPPDIVSAVRYHTTGRAGMTLLEKILFIADFISADRDYPGVDEMRERAKSSLEYAMLEGLRFTINELSAEGRVIHPDSVAAYNETVLINNRKG